MARKKSWVEGENFFSYIAAALALFSLSLIGWVCIHKVIEANYKRQEVIERCFGKELVLRCSGDLYLQALQECTDDKEEARK
jgi:hypothetical protein